MLGQMYIALPFSMINVLAFQHDANGNIMADMLLPLSIFIFLWTNDTGAYCSGSLFGKHKLFHASALQRAGKAALAVAFLSLPWLC